MRRDGVYRGIGKDQGGRGGIRIARYGVGNLIDWFVSGRDCGVLEVGMRAVVHGLNLGQVPGYTPP